MDMDTVVLLTRSAFYVCDYDDGLDKFTQSRRIALRNVSRMQCGPMLKGGSSWGFRNFLLIFGKNFVKFGSAVFLFLFVILASRNEDDQ